MNKLGFLWLLCLIGSGFLSPLSPVSATDAKFIDCIIIKYSECPTCTSIFENEIRPFYEKYQYNETIEFTVIDAATQITLYLDIISELGINPSDYGNLPWVIFTWGEDQLQVFDVTNLDLIELTFETILSDLGYVPSGDPGASSPDLDIIRIDLLIFSGFFVVLFLGVVSSAVYLYQTKLKPEIFFIRISKQRFLVLAISSLISIFALTYQLLDHIQGGCGCATTNIVKSLLFRRYDHLNILGVNIPFALLGLGLMLSILILVFLVASLPIPWRISFPYENKFEVDKRIISFAYNCLVFISFLAVISLFYLLYLELFVIEFICVFCTISQIIIVVNTALILTWNPFPKADEEQSVGQK